MASTRTKNTNGNYCLEQKTYHNSQNYTTYKYSQYGEAYDTKLSGLGLLPGQIPNNNLSENYSDIESFLFGINSTNLVKPQAPVVPEQKTIPTIKYFNTVPLFMPAPLVIENKQRPTF